VFVDNHSIPFFSHLSYFFLLQFFYVEFVILEGDNLTSIFMSMTFDWNGFHANGRHFFGVLFALVVLPNVWLRDLQVISLVINP
jgi:solute carrier family 32 (vesicular inhibitory amino acid transporter)